MSTKIHNVRFYKPEAVAICCMSYEPKLQKLAILRKNSSIEIWNLVHSPHVERRIASTPEASIEAIAWYKGRLFSVSLYGYVCEYDLFRLSQKYKTTVTGGAALCLDLNKNSNCLAAGTEDGYLNLFEVEDEELVYKKLLDKQEGRILCLKFDKTGQFIASGSLDAIRIWKVETGHAVHRMTTGRSENNKETVVWCLDVTDDFTVISGDSRGYICFWDGEVGSQIESYRSHQTDVLSLCLSEDQKSIYCAGVDPIIMTYVKIQVKDGNFKWVKSIQRKIHDYDVRSLVLANDKLYSGGIDGYLACSFYPPKTLIKYPPLRQDCVSIAKQARCILLQYLNHLEMWSLGKAEGQAQSDGFLDVSVNPKKLLRLETKSNEVILCSCLSNNGKLIAYSTNRKVKIYYFSKNEDNLQVTPISELPENYGPCSQTVFTGDNKSLILTPHTGGIIILTFSESGVHNVQKIDVSNYLSDTITTVTVSPCGHYFVTATPTGEILGWSHGTGEWKLYCSLPKYESSPTALSVQNKSCYLVVAYADQKVIEYNLKLKKFTTFSRKLNENYPKQWLNRNLPINHITFDPRNSDIILLHDDSTLCVIDKGKTLPTPDVKIPRVDYSHSGSGDRSTHTFQIFKKYKHLVYLNWLSGDELAVVEVPPDSLIEQLPPCFPQKLFGTK